MNIIIDCEGDPVQEFSALYVNFSNGVIADVFHRHVKYPFPCDRDYFSRRHVHGLDRNFLQIQGLRDEPELVSVFHEWLTTHPYDNIYAHAPHKEAKLLSLSVRDVC